MLYNTNFYYGVEIYFEQIMTNEDDYHRFKNDYYYYFFFNFYYCNVIRVPDEVLANGQRRRLCCWRLMTRGMSGGQRRPRQNDYSASTVTAMTAMIYPGPRSSGEGSHRRHTITEALIIIINIINIIIIVVTVFVKGPYSYWPTAHIPKMTHTL